MISQMISPFLHPSIPLVLCGLICAFSWSTLKKFLQILGPVAALVFLLLLPAGSKFSIPFINDYTLYPIAIDDLGWLFALAIIGITLFANIYALNNNSKTESFGSMLYAAASVGVALCGDLVTFIFCWELMTVTALLLIWSKQRPSSTGSGFRYLMVHMFGGNLMLAGILYIIISGNSILITSLSENMNPGFWLILIAVCINAAVVPFHPWLVDAYPNSSISGIVYLNSFTTKIAVFAMIRFFAGTQILIWAGVIMAIYGACFAIIENNFRKLLSYHIISQVGFMVAAAGMGTHMAINGAAAHTVNNIIYKSLLFMCMGIVMYATGTDRINKLGGLYKKLPLCFVCFAIAALSIAGFPGFAGFISKPMIGEAAIEAGLPIVAFLLNVAGIGTVLSIPCKMGYFIFLAPADKEITTKPVPKNMNIAMVALTCVCIVIGIFPDLMYNLLPYTNEYHPFDIHIILEYLQILPAAVVPFILFRKIMKPHSKLTIDTDWFYRRPLPLLINKISSLIVSVQRVFGKIGYKIYNQTSFILTDNNYKSYPLFRRVPIGITITTVWAVLTGIIILLGVLGWHYL